MTTSTLRLYLCTNCGRRFGSQDALDQHSRDSPAHVPSFICDDCNRRFGSQDALDQHMRDAPAHIPSFDCDDCDRRFGSQDALDQHLRHSPAHIPSFNCDDCDRRFGSQDALDQHMRDAPAHIPSFDCDDCDRRFSSQDALDQHLRNSPAHVPSFDCDDCGRRFGSQDALHQHMRDAPAHALVNTYTPLDEFFLSYYDFDYDPSAPPSEEFSRLKRHQNWSRGSPESEEGWQRYRDALVREFNDWYGEDSNSLKSWHSLCRAIGISPLPMSCEGCRKAAKSHHVNMVDLVQIQRAGGGRVRVFESLDDLRAYTRENRRYFPKDSLKAGALLRALLREIFVT